MNISKINNISYNKPSFGHISSGAVDALRYKSEGYIKKYTYDLYDDYCDSPYMSEYYEISTQQKPRMNAEQISVLEGLVKRASILKKSAIRSAGIDRIYITTTNKLGQMVDDTQTDGKVCYSFKAGDIDENLKVLGDVVERAEYLEGAKEFDVKRTYKDDKYVRIDKSQRRQSEFRNIYDNTYCGD